MITFLIAGHETTSGLLSFLFVMLIQHPEAYAKLHAEIDSVLGTGPITVDHLKDLSYTKACLWEALRLEPPSGVWTVTRMKSDPKAPVVLEQKWEFKNGQTMVIVNRKLQRGRAFALQEATLAIALLFQKFDFELVDPNYKLSVKQNLALKPEEYLIYAKLRPHVDIMSLQRDLFSEVPKSTQKASPDYRSG
ncbi:cytochrome P450 [Hypoxylon sp. NC1633]|nr:cytochrome P450 [Hypoxylon sp. NC1633]